MKINIIYVNIEGEDEQVAETMKGVGQIVSGISDILTFFNEDMPVKKTKISDAPGFCPPLPCRKCGLLGKMCVCSSREVEKKRTVKK